MKTRGIASRIALFIGDTMLHRVPNELGRSDIMKPGKKKIIIVGCGPGAESYITPAARAAAAKADLFGRRILGSSGDREPWL